jgi:hypothetical protein
VKYLLTLIAVSVLFFTLPLSSPGSLLFSDDFESYNIGDDIASSSMWMNMDPTALGVFRVISDGYDKAIWGDMNGKKSNCFYLHPTYGVITDCYSQIDFKMDAEESCALALTLRYSGVYPSDWEIYYGSLNNGLYKGMAILDIYYVHNGTYENLNELVINDFDLSIWHNMRFVAIGDSTIDLALILDDDVILSAQDNPGRISWGDAGIGLECYTPGGSQTFLLDNYALYSIEAGIQPQSLGRVKCLYR